MGITECRKNNASLEFIEVNSSPFAVGIYEKLGFIRVSDEQLKNGMKFTPMVKKWVDIEQVN
jgi:predicted GNAT family N-acyltransferase